MKKILSCVMALSIAACAAMSASADQTWVNEDTGSKTITLQKELSSTYTVTIPDSGPVDPTSVTELPVTVSDVLLKDNENLKVSVKSENGFKLKCGDASKNHEIGYTMKIGEGSPLSGNSETAVLENINNDSVKLSETLNISDVEVSNAECAGTYTDTLTFTVDVSEVM